MTKPSAAAIGFAIWAILLVPVTLLMQWLELVERTFVGFLMAFGMLAVISFTYELFERWVEQRLRRGRERATSATPPEH